MAKKDKYEPHQDSSYNRSRGRRDGGSGQTSQQTSNRERNVSHSKAEEHSIRAKGNRG